MASSSLPPPSLWIPFLLLSLCGFGVSHALANSGRTYNYFAFGSNMASSTMINLRNLSPIAQTAAILPGHRLVFNIPGVPGVEPSSAAVEPVESSVLQQPVSSNKALYVDNLLEEEVVHGVLYKLSEQDFATICQTEGVPLAYVLHRCRVVPYVGDGKRAGEECLKTTLSSKKATILTNDAEMIDWGVPAFTLRAARKEWRSSKDIPPSQSYLNVLIRGAEEFSLDEKYRAKLKSTPVGKTLLGQGLAEGMLQMAERRKGFSPF